MKERLVSVESGEELLERAAETIGIDGKRVARLDLGPTCLEATHRL